MANNNHYGFPIADPTTYSSACLCTTGGDDFQFSCAAYTSMPRKLLNTILTDFFSVPLGPLRIFYLINF
jgi:hypothetical protein